MNQLALAVSLNHQATLSDFCWGSNEILKQQLHDTLEQQGERFLYLCGEKGTGKSHLLQACCQNISQQNRAAAYLPLSILKEWGPETIIGLENQHLIAIDDIEVIGGNSAWEEALFHLYNHVRDNDNTILLVASQSLPSTLPIQLADLTSRLGWGLTIQIQPLSDELKQVTLIKQAQKRGFQLSEQVALFLLSHCERNMHSLQDLLNTLDEASLTAQRKITIPFVKSVLKL